MIKTWQQRCEEHPDHDGIVSDGMIQARMQEEIDELRTAMEPVVWHPIETAPKDRTLLVCRRHSTIPTMAKWNAEYEWFEDLNGDHLYDLTHWMPLPPAPGAAPRKWQGLTEDDVKAPIQRAMQHFGFDPTQYSLGGLATIGFLGLVNEIEAKLKEKNT